MRDSLKVKPYIYNFAQKVLAIRDTFFAYVIYFGTILISSTLKTKSRSTQKPHLIIILEKFPPAITGGVYRPLSFAKSATEAGWSVTVVCEEPPKAIDEAGKYLSNQIPPSVEIIKIKKSSLKPSFNWFPQVDGGFINALTYFYHTPRSRSCKTVVLASGPPFFSFIAGNFVAIRERARLVLDYRDEWSLSPFDFVTLGKSDQIWEARCLHRADSILITTESFRNELTNRFQHIQDHKILLFPNGYEPSDFEQREPPDTSRPKDNFDIAYLGYLGEHTGISSLICDLSVVLKIDPEIAEKLRVFFYGKCDPRIQEEIQKSPISSIFHFLPQVDKRQAIRKMIEHDVLLLMNPQRMHRYLPGKLFEYVASRTPILVYGKGGEIERAIRTTASGVCVDAGATIELRKTLIKLMCHSNTESISDHKRNSWLCSHDRTKIGRKLIDHLESLI